MKKHLISTLASILFLALMVSHAPAQTVSAVQSAIKAKGATWVAGENHITRLTPEQQKKLFGVLNAPKPYAKSAPILQTAVGLPPSLDWRNNGGNYVTPVKDTGNGQEEMCGTAWAFSAIAALESATLIANKTPNTDLDLSEQVLISCCNTVCSPYGDCNGGYVDKAANFLRDTGAPQESCYPYTWAGACGNACPNWQASAYKITSWKWVVDYEQNEAPSVAKIKAGLLHGPLVTTMVVYMDWIYYGTGVYTHVWGDRLGNQVYLVVGYDDAGQYFIVKNSWGPTWGESGYFRIAYSEVAGDSQFGYITQAYYVGADPDPTCDSTVGDYFDAKGGTGSIQLSITDGCMGTGLNNDYWITFTSGGYPHLSGAIGYTVAPNTSSSPRSGVLELTDDAGAWRTNYVVYQDAGSGSCTSSISPTTNSFTDAGGTGSISVTAGSGCPWTAVCTAAPSIAGIIDGASGSGNGVTHYSLKANNSAYPRTVTFKVAEKDFTVTQSGCPTSFTPTSQNFSADGGTGTASVTASYGCEWETWSNVPWITTTSTWVVIGNGTVSYSVAANTGTSSRTGTVTIGGKVLTVTQAGGSTCTVSLGETSKHFTAQGGGGAVLVTAPSRCSWLGTSSARWIGIGAGGANGVGSGTGSYYVEPNFDLSSRTGTVSVNGQTLTVTQDGSGCTYSITPTAQNFTASGGSGTINLTATSGCYWKATSDAYWITINSGESGSGNGTVHYSLMGNTSTASRTGTVTVGGQTFTVTQAGGSTCTYTITPTSQSFSAVSGTGTVNVTAGSGCSWTAASGAWWITVTGGASGSGNASVNYSVAANSGTGSRTGTMTIAGQNFTVGQDGMSCTYAINPTSQSFASATGTGTVNVTAGSGCAWTATSNATSWLTVTSGASGSGNGTVGYAVTANTGNSSRTSTLTIGGQTFTVTQTGQSCTYAISPTSNSFTAAAATGSVGVTCSASGCSWTAVSNATSWLTVSSGASGSGNGTVGYAVTANTATTSRTGTLTVGGQTFTVTQAGQACTFALNPTSQSFTFVTGTGTVNVTSSSGCAWTASSNASWIIVTGGASGSGNGSVSYAVAANTATSSRTGTMTIAGQTFTVTQTGQACTYTLNPTSQSFTSGTGSGTVNVTTAAGCAWTASSNASWITVVSGSNGSSNGSVNYSVGANASTSSRTGTMTIGGQNFTVSQAGATPTCSVYLTTAGFNLGYAARQASIAVQASSTCSWSASTNVPWITFVSGATGTGIGTVTFAVSANNGAARTGTITIGTNSVTINQTGSSTCAYTLSSGSQSFTSASGTGTVTLASVSGCAWTASSNAAWITVISGTSGTGSGTVSYSVGANTGASRTGTLTIAGQTFTVSQAGTTTCTYSINPTSQSFSAGSGTGSVNVTSASGCGWTASSTTSWISITSGTNGTGSGAVGYSVGANTGASRTGTLTIAGQTFTVSQAGTTTCTYSITPTSQSFSAGSGTGTVSVTSASGCAWTASSTTSWISITSGTNGTGSGAVGYSVGANTGASRTGTLTIAGQTFTVSQAGTAPTCSVTLTTAGFNVGYAARQLNIPVQASSTCSWSASTNVSWISFISGAMGKGNGTVTFAVGTNTGSARTGTVTINGTSVTVNQTGTAGK